MTDRRRNWKAKPARETQERSQQKIDLLAALDASRWEIQECGVDFVQYDEIKKRQREIVAKLATI